MKNTYEFTTEERNLLARARIEEKRYFTTTGKGLIHCANPLELNEYLSMFALTNGTDEAEMFYRCIQLQLDYYKIYFSEGKEAADVEEQRKLSELLEKIKPVDKTELEDIKDA